MKDNILMAAVSALMVIGATEASAGYPDRSQKAHKVQPDVIEVGRQVIDIEAKKAPGFEVVNPTGVVFVKQLHQVASNYEINGYQWKCYPKKCNRY